MLKRLTIEQQAYEIISDWGLVEGFVNKMFIWQFRIENFDLAQAKFLSDKLTFSEKYNFLKQQGIFKKEEINHINKFQNQRNRLFHGRHGIAAMKGIVGAETIWENLHTTAKNASTSVYKAFLRENKKEWSPWSQ